MKKQVYFLSVLALISCQILIGTTSVFAQDPYITVWKSDNYGTTDTNQITVPAEGDYSYSWEEVGNPANNGSGSGSGIDTLTFPHAGTYRLSMTPDSSNSNPFNRINFDTVEDHGKIIQIEQWGTIAWSSLGHAYVRASNLIISATDTPDLSNVTNMAYAFAQTDIDTVPNMNNWDVSHVVNMTGIFSNDTHFNQPIGNWDVSNVEYMGDMFYGAPNFNQDLSAWDVSQVTVMGGLFYGSAFNQPIGDWDVSHVTDMSAMFCVNNHFNQPIGNWDVHNVIYMDMMFEQASQFNQPIGDWDVHNVTNMRFMFNEATHFNQPINDWDVSHVGDFGYILTGATDFNQSLEDWTISGVWGLGMVSLSGTAMDCQNYSRTVRGWANNPNTDSNVILEAYGLQYSPDVTAGRDYLIQSLHWAVEQDMLGNCTLGIVKNEKANPEVFPNPTHAKVLISGLSGKNTIRLIDMTGRLLQKYTTNRPAFSISLDNYTSGLYQLLITSDKGRIISKKIIKQ